MLLNRYYIVYVEVPSGHPGVDDIFASSKEEAIKAVDGKRIAIIAITEGR